MKLDKIEYWVKDRMKGFNVKSSQIHQMEKRFWITSKYSTFVTRIPSERIWNVFNFQLSRCSPTPYIEPSSHIGMYRGEVDREGFYRTEKSLRWPSLVHFLLWSPIWFLFVFLIFYNIFRGIHGNILSNSVFLMQTVMFASFFWFSSLHVSSATNPDLSDIPSPLDVPFMIDNNNRILYVQISTKYLLYIVLSFGSAPTLR